MEAVNVEIVENDSINKWREETLKRLKNSDVIIEWCKQQGVDLDIIEKYVGRFNDYDKAMQLCKQCLGLSYCSHNQGQRLELYIDDNHLQHHYVLCPYALKQKARLEHSRYYKQADFNEDWFLLDLKQLNVKKESLEYQKVVAIVMENLIKNDSKGLYLWGYCGVGKSYLAACISNYYASKKIKVAFVNVPKLMSDLKALFDDEDAFSAKLKMLKQVEVLILDDLGGESITSWSRDEILLTILDERMKHKKKTFFTTNYNLSQLETNYTYTKGNLKDGMGSKRLMERIKVLAKEVFMKGDSRRK